MAAALVGWLRQRPRLVLFGLALLARLVCGTITFGSVDLVNCIVVTPQVLANHRLEEVPYLPTISLFVFLGGALALKTPIPIALAYKLFPILFDSLLAVLIHDVVRHRFRQGAFAAGALYCFSPIALLIVCFQVQWDPLWVFFVVLAFHVRDDFACSQRKYLLFGALFGVSILFKPIALFLLPFFCTPDALRAPTRRLLSFQASAAAGLVGVLLLAGLLFHLSGYSLVERASAIGRYSARGVTMFGLPFAWPFDQAPLLHSRVWLVGVLTALALPYARRRLDTFAAVLVAFCLVVGLAGLSPQYLFWPVPFLLLTRRLVAAAFYHVLAGVFLLLFYLNPLASYYPGENMATFALLEPLAWAMPPASWTDAGLLALERLLGNYALPLFALALAGRLLWQRGCEQPAAAPAGSLAPLWGRYGRVLVSGALLTVGLRVLLGNTGELARSFTPAFVLGRLEAYHLRVLSSNGPTVGIYPEGDIFHLGWAVLLLALGWGLAAVFLARPINLVSSPAAR